VADARGVSDGWTRQMLDAVAVPVFGLDPEYRYIAFNAAHADVMRTTWGVEIAEGACLFDYLPPGEARDAAIENMTRSLAGERVTSSVWFGDGSTPRRLFSLIRGPIVTDGKVVGVAVVSVDETERKHVEDELRASEERYRALVEAVRDIVFVIDRDDRIEFVNEAAAAWLQASPEELIGKPRADVFPSSDDWSRHQAGSLRKVIETGEPLYLEHPARFPGGMRWQATSLAALRDGDGQIVGVLGIGRDITERKQAEQRHLGELEQLAHADALTGLLNRRGFDLLSEQAVAQAARAGQGVGVIYGDMDGLKAINDELGHAAGDQALRDMATVLRVTLRSADVIARVGGDEFVVLAVGEDEASIHLLAERLHEGIAVFNSAREGLRPLAMSSGVAWRSPGETFKTDVVVEEADLAMYGEKARRAMDRG